MILLFILYAFCIIALVFLWSFTLKKYRTLPEIIPVHFDLDGKPDRCGKKGMIFFGPVFCTVFFVFFLWISQFPETAHFPVPHTADNENRQNMIMNVFLCWLIFLITLFFINTQDFLIRYISDSSAKAKFSLFSILVTLFLSVAAVVIISAVLP